MRNRDRDGAGEVCASAIPREVSEEHTAYLTTEISGLFRTSASFSFGETVQQPAQTQAYLVLNSPLTTSLLFMNGNQTLGLCQNKRLSPPRPESQCNFLIFYF